MKEGSLQPEVTRAHADRGPLDEKRPPLRIGRADSIAREFGYIGQKRGVTRQEQQRLLDIDRDARGAQCAMRASSPADIAHDGVSVRSKVTLRDVGPELSITISSARQANPADKLSH